jgi:hypothetical protein
MTDDGCRFVPSLRYTYCTVLLMTTQMMPKTVSPLYFLIVICRETIRNLGDIHPRELILAHFISLRNEQMSLPKYDVMMALLLEKTAQKNWDVTASQLWTVSGSSSSSSSRYGVPDTEIKNMVRCQS